MLDKEKELDAVVIATPDFWHAQHAVDCLKAGKHVYCEKEMSNTLEGARAMVAAARETGKLLQIGHQRRSNPRYLHCYEKLLGEAKLLGRIVTINGQWNRAVTPDLGAPDRYAIPEARLKQYGFKDMHQFRNWRWYKGLGGGPIVDLGSHQIDIYTWFLGANPSAVTASGGQLYHDPETHEWYDTVMVVYDYDTPAGPGQGVLPDADDQRQPGLLRELHGRPGDAAHLRVGSPRRPSSTATRTPPPGTRGSRRATSPPQDPGGEGEGRRRVTDVRESVSPDEHKVPIVLRDPYHQPHLQNFFDAVRGKAKLNCPAEVGVRERRSPCSRSTRRSRRSPGCRSSPRTSRSRGAWTWKTGSSPAGR